MRSLRTKVIELEEDFERGIKDWYSHINTKRKSFCCEEVSARGVCLVPEIDLSSKNITVVEVIPLVFKAEVTLCERSAAQCTSNGHIKGWVSLRNTQRYHATGKHSRGCLPACLSCLPAYLPICLPPCLPANLPSYLPLAWATRTDTRHGISILNTHSCILESMFTGNIDLNMMLSQSFWQTLCR